LFGRTPQIDLHPALRLGHAEGGGTGQQTLARMGTDRPGQTLRQPDIAARGGEHRITGRVLPLTVAAGKAPLAEILIKAYRFALTPIR
jgi:hypothetical protein